MIYFVLFLEFFKIGLFSVGGGLATIPFLYDLIDKYNWFNENMLIDMIAVSESTPGAIGVNMATFSGFESAGILGSIVSTLGLVAPSLIIIVILAKFLQKFKESEVVKSVFLGLRPAVTALIAAAGFQVIRISLITINKFELTNNILDLIDIKSTIIMLVLLFAIRKYKKHPIVYIASAAVLGIIFKL